MSAHIQKSDLSVTAAVVDFIETRALPGSGVSAAAFWSGLSALVNGFGDENRALLARRKELQEQIDAWYKSRAGSVPDASATGMFLREIGYLVEEGDRFEIETTNTDPEIALIPGPQLVVPVMNARYALNAANARWGSLYDALYGTDALGDLPPRGGYDSARGTRVIAWGKAFLDQIMPLAEGSWVNVDKVQGGAVLTPALKLPQAYVGFIGDAETPTAVLLKTITCTLKLKLIRIRRWVLLTRREFQIFIWKVRFLQLWIAKIQSLQSMARTKFWPGATGLA